MEKKKQANIGIAIGVMVRNHKLIAVSFFLLPLFGALPQLLSLLYSSSYFILRVWR
jgi:hypothetical protein